MNSSPALQIDAAVADTTPVRRSGLDRAAVAAGLLTYLALVGVAWWAVVRFAPDQASVRVLGKIHLIRALHERILGPGALMLLILPSTLWLEVLAIGWARSSVRQLLFEPNASNKMDLACFFIGQTPLLNGLGRLMTLGLSMLSGMKVHDWLIATFGLSIDPSPLPFAVQVVLYFFVYTFFDYWTHRVDHSRYFWPLHRYHHSTEDFCVVSTARTHPAAFTSIFLINMPMAVLGASPEVMIDVNVVTIALGFLIHSRIDSNFGWIGRWIVQSPNHHRLHHILDQTVPTGHFAMAPIWDHLFGTWRGEADQTLVIGVAEPYRQGLWIAPDLLRDYFDFLKGLAQPIARIPRLIKVTR
jgi:sterol desaturase/sphingolipid hydroxylase (fatty acid hydroxylase superfamily)